MKKTHMMMATAALSLAMCGMADMAMAAPHKAKASSTVGRFQPHSSDALNQQQLAKAQTLGTEPGVADVPAGTPMANDMAKTPVDSSQPANSTADAMTAPSTTESNVIGETAGSPDTTSPAADSTTPAPDATPTVKDPAPATDPTLPDAGKPQSPSNPTDAPDTPTKQ